MEMEKIMRIKNGINIYEIEERSCVVNYYIVTSLGEKEGIHKTDADLYKLIDRADYVKVDAGNGRENYVTSIGFGPIGIDVFKNE